MFFINIVILVTHINVLKLRCSHGMIHMSMRHKNNNRLIGQLLHAGLQTSDSASRINQRCLFRALHQIHQLGCERINSGNSPCYFFCFKNKTLIHCPVFFLFPYFPNHSRGSPGSDAILILFSYQNTYVTMLCAGTTLLAISS